MSDKTVLEIEHEFIRKKDQHSHTEVMRRWKKSMGNLVQKDLKKREKKKRRPKTQSRSEVKFQTSSLHKHVLNCWSRKVPMVKE